MWLHRYPYLLKNLEITALFLYLGEGAKNLISLGDLQWRHIKMVRKIDFLKICVNVLLKNMNPRIEIYFL